MFKTLLSKLKNVFIRNKSKNVDNASEELKKTNASNKSTASSTTTSIMPHRLSLQPIPPYGASTMSPYNTGGFVSKENVGNPHSTFEIQLNRDNLVYLNTKDVWDPKLDFLKQRQKDTGLINHIYELPVTEKTNCWSLLNENFVHFLRMQKGDYSLASSFYNRLPINFFHSFDKSNTYLRNTSKYEYEYYEISNTEAIYNNKKDELQWIKEILKSRFEA